MGKDLVVLVADVQQEQTLERILERRRDSLGIRPIQYDIYRHPQKDPGVFKQSSSFLAPYRPPAFQRALVVLDAQWTGAPGDATFLRKEIRNRFVKNGWHDDDFEVIVIDPELEAWVWTNSPAVPRVLRTTWPDIRAVGHDNGYWPEVEGRPAQPKELLEEVLRAQGRPRSAAVFRELAEVVGFAKCEDDAFCLLRDTLVRWFAKAKP